MTLINTIDSKCDPQDQECANCLPESQTWNADICSVFFRCRDAGADQYVASVAFGRPTLGVHPVPVTQQACVQRAGRRPAFRPVSKHFPARGSRACPGLFHPELFLPGGARPELRCLRTACELDGSPRQCTDKTSF